MLQHMGSSRAKGLKFRKFLLMGSLGLPISVPQDLGSIFMLFFEKTQTSDQWLPMKDHSSGASLWWRAILSIHGGLQQGWRSNHCLTWPLCRAALVVSIDCWLRDILDYRSVACKQSMQLKCTPLLCRCWSGSCLCMPFSQRLSPRVSAVWLTRQRYLISFPLHIYSLLQCYLDVRNFKASCTGKFCMWQPICGACALLGVDRKVSPCPLERLLAVNRH